MLHMESLKNELIRKNDLNVLSIISSKMTLAFTRGLFPLLPSLSPNSHTKCRGIMEWWWIQHLQEILGPHGNQGNLPLAEQLQPCSPPVSGTTPLRRLSCEQQEQ